MADILPRREADWLFEASQDLQEITRFGAAFDEIARQHDLSQQVLYHLNLAVDELLSNVIKYGFEEGQPFWAQIAVWFDPDRVTMELKDRGKPFDPLEDAIRPDTKLSIEEREIGGLGIHFVREMMNETVYQRADGYNKLVLVKYRSET